MGGATALALRTTLPALARTEPSPRRRTVSASVAYVVPSRVSPQAASPTNGTTTTLFRAVLLNTARA